MQWQHVTIQGGVEGRDVT
ncbi:hypothetical protein C352_03764 [Cryptococcus neoformans CHC193]|nr:hypothetical protein C352_03764 [Cryptococcus neoformans var. grubii CHC193]